MTRFVVNMDSEAEGGTIGFGGYTEPKKASRLRRALLLVFGLMALAVLVAGVWSYLYWQSLKDTPQYSLALIVDAARHDDQATINRLVDTNALVDDFMPQVTAKAIELYGRGQPPKVIARVQQIATPLIPAVKERARAELPRLVRQKTETFERVPFGAMVVGAERYLEIGRNGETALIKSRLPEHSFEVRMKRAGSEWKIVGIRDDQLATNTARAIGQEIIAIAANGGNPSRNSLGVKNLSELLREAEEVFR